MSYKEVYINNTAAFFPNEPIPNEEMEAYLGLINGKPSRSRAIVLRNNGIKNRYYAITKEGKSTHTNSQMASLAIRGLFDNNAEALKSIDLISCGTSSPDQLMPSHGVMVHGWLPETNAIEVVSPAGVCCAGMHALKYAYLATKTGEAHQAVASGSERLAVSLKASNFEEEAQKLTELNGDPYISFEKEFLRWMLSDGAGAFLLSDKKNETGISLKIEWLDAVSNANELPTCMYMGNDILEDGTVKGYADFTPEEVLEKSIFSIKQDVKLLSKHVISYGVDGLKTTLEKYGVKVEDLDYFLPHISSEFFKGKLHQDLVDKGIAIPYEKWFLNLSRVGNVGAASVYFMVNELFHSGKLKLGDKILLLVPESSRFSYVYGLLTVC